MKDKSYANYFKLDMSDIDNGNITIESNFYNETVIYKNETKTDVLSEVLFDGTKENKATLHAISEDELKENGRIVIKKEGTPSWQEPVPSF